ncbi:uncharacterized protein THITE_2050784 [Thermothielavioides terrestris NRRL 8126]|uniref:Uncharacterized protein n=1 Tax=Thermothielavioides terrestris (strain ATCC 38088 / NRRL 8126) TaxID=578455 RepID=G2R8J5_THETT|nr:uncharacterized protein THITE_2050784 [Thermothielavioides terrestris NRRL 8126]AEO67410.1 hypothetical protein THITE_2050784 [Thermothielavioides terrestris NRRL 8126]
MIQSGNTLPARAGAARADGSLDEATAVAVIGMACRFPDADSIEEFWELLSAGKSAVRALPTHRFKPSDLTREPRDAGYHGNFLRNPDHYDHRFFGMSGREAKNMDPQQRLVLQVAYETLESAGYFGVNTPHAERDVGCYLGVGAVDYQDNVASHDANAFSALGTLRAFVSGRISHYFGWSGPSITYDTACSSGAVAIHSAVNAIRSGECAMALAGGVNVITSPALWQNLAAASFLSPTGASRAFDASADGYCRGEGAGLVLLKPLSRATADGDAILAVITGSAVNQGANCTPITVPHSDSQSALYKKALSQAGTDPQDVTFVEAHGTGTPVGDPIEVESIRKTFGGPNRVHELFLGSVKDNIGHTEAASGAAALIKTVLMMQKRAVPKQANFKRLNPKIPALEPDRITIPTATQPWTIPRPIALVNNYGAAGSNAALVVQYHGAPAVASLGLRNAALPFFISAKTPESLLGYCTVLKAAVSRMQKGHASLAYNLSVKQNRSFDYNYTFIASSLDQVAAALDRAQVTRVEAKRSVVLCLGDQDGRAVGLDEALFQNSKLLQKHLGDCERACQALRLPSLFPAIFGPAPAQDLVTLHSRLFSLQYSSAKAWLDCGLTVDTIVGQGFGLLTALAVAGVLSVPDALRFISSRARLIQSSLGQDSGAALTGQGNQWLGSGLLESIAPGLRQVAATLEYRQPSIPIEAPSMVDAETLVQYSRMSDHFEDAIQRIVRRLGPCVFLEAGSASPIVSLAQRALATNADGKHLFQSIDIRSPGAGVRLAEAVARLWAAGVRVQYWPFHRIQKNDFSWINLPPYQFQKNSFWIDYVAPKTASTLGTAPTTPLLEPFESGEEGAVTFLLHTTHEVFRHCTQGHAVLGQSLCPASMYVETALRAAELLRESPVQSSASVKDLRISSPLTVGTTRTVLVQLTPKSSVEWAFTVLSRAQPDATASIEHASGVIDVGPDPRRVQFLRRLVGPAKCDELAHSSGVKSLSGADIYQVFGQVVDYASYYRGVDRIVSKVSEAAAKVRAPARHPIMNEASCDPITLDNFLQVAGIHVNCLSERSANEVFVCTELGELFLTDGFLANRREARLYKVYSSSTTQTAKSIVNDILIFDSETGDLVVVFSGAIFQAVSTKSLEKTLRKLNSDVDSTELSEEHSVPSAPDVVDSKPQQDQELAQPTVNGISTATVEPEDGSALPRVCELFSQVIEIPIEDVKPTSSLEELGVDSLMSTEVLNEIKKQFHVVIPADVFLSLGDIQSVAQFLSHRGPPVATAQQKPQPRLSGTSQTVNGSAQNPAPAAETRHIPTYEAVVDEPLVNPSIVSSNAPEILANSETKSGISILSEELPDLPDVLAAALRCQASGAEPKSFAAIAHSSFVQVQRDIEPIQEQLKFAGFYSAVYPAQMELIVRYIVEAFGAMGCSLDALKPGDRVPDISVLAQHGKVKRQLYHILEVEGIVEQDAAGGFIRTATAVPGRPSEQLLQEILAKFPQHTFEYKLLASTGSKLAECLTGRANPLEILFGSAQARTLMEDVYTYAPMLEAGTVNLGRYLVKVFENFTESRPIRILEIGAGTGGTTKHLIEQLVATRKRFEYTFSDLSSSLVAAAKKKFAQHDFMRYAIFNVEQEPTSQFAHQYDIIISSNCIHATKNLTQTCSNINKCLQPDGVLCLVELTRNLYWFDLVFGLLEGWWLFDDGRRHALADEGLWRKNLIQAGFRWIDWTVGTSRESNVLRVITASPAQVEGASEPVTMETVTFKQEGSVALQADLYYPQESGNGNKARPIALMIHGGGHVMLSRRDIRPPQTEMLLAAGFLPVSVDYRLAPEVTLVDGPMRDVCDALAWARDTLPHLSLKRPDIRADGTQVVAVGWSTGGHLALTLGFTAPARGIRPPEATLAFYCPTDYEDPFWTRPNLPFGSRAQLGEYDLLEGVSATGPITAYNPPKRALGGWMSPSDPRSRIALHMNWTGRSLRVLLNGLSRHGHSIGHGDPTDTLPEPSPEQVRAVSPLAQIRRGNYKVPTFLIHGTKDDLIPWQQALRTHEALRQANVEAEIRILDGALHLFDMFRTYEGDSNAKAAVREGYEFLSKHVRFSQ